MSSGLSDEKDEWIVDWNDQDPHDPKNFTLSRKIWITFILCIGSLTPSLTSSIVSPADEEISQEFNISREVTVLVVSIFVLAFAVGPLVWGPASELFGRRCSLIPGLLGVGIFSIASGFCRSVPALLITRFLGGTFGSATVSNGAPCIGDIFEDRTRGIASSFYAVATVGGPTLGPVIGAAINVKLSWRWTEWIAAMWIFIVFALLLFTLPETYAPVLLSRKAKALRIKDSRYWHPHEAQKLDLRTITTKHLVLPMKMLTTEPIVICVALYASFVYGLIYVTLQAFPVVFTEQRGYSKIPANLPFLGLFIGSVCSIPINCANQPYYQRKCDQNDGHAVPEGRCPPMAIGAVIFAIGLFWFGWTAAPQIPWPVPTVAAGFIGAGFGIIFLQCTNYLVDTYGVYSASAISANTTLRALMGAVLPLAARPMLHNIGVGPGMSILGGFASLALPVPVLLICYGVLVRSKSKLASKLEENL